jgi:hypothetical protein
MERYFFNTFGYIEIKLNTKINLIPIFEHDIEKVLGLKHIDTNKPVYDNIDERKHNLRNINFISDNIFNIFYNQYILNQIYKITDDFIILSPIESFYLIRSNIHRDLAAEVKTIKLLFYLDDVSDITKGPLYIIPGSQNMYDKYSNSIGDMVSWPHPARGRGDGFCNFTTFLEENIPKKYLFSNADKIIMFNTNLFHGSDGNLIHKSQLRRSIGMTIICIDRNDPVLMKKIDNFYRIYNVNNETSQAYTFCKHYNKYNWLKHFYIPSKIDDNFQHSSDGTDKNALVLSDKINRWNNYITTLKNLTENEDIHNTIFNCYKEQIKSINTLEDEDDIQGI